MCTLSPPAAVSDTVGFIGLGNMGRGMADNLVTKVTVLMVAFLL